MQFLGILQDFTYFFICEIKYMITQSSIENTTNLQNITYSVQVPHVNTKS